MTTKELIEEVGIDGFGGGKRRRRWHRKTKTQLVKEEDEDATRKKTTKLVEEDAGISDLGFWFWERIGLSEAKSILMWGSGRVWYHKFNYEANLKWGMPSTRLALHCLPPPRRPRRASYWICLTWTSMRHCGFSSRRMSPSVRIGAPLTRWC